VTAEEKLEKLESLAADSAIYGLSDNDAVAYFALREEILAMMRAAEAVCP
jgi:hypothetical protein